ncbi:hypothetical protein JXC34_06425 [Candidatus Woesearchaeota archaeon]|nr:hypothetical protein [Candidatus Woesearchaeota archaeon]
MPCAFSLYETEVFNGWIYADTPMEIDGENYTFSYSRSSDLSLVYLPGGKIAAIDPDVENCTTEWIYKVCQSELIFEKYGVSVIKDIHGDNINVSANLQIYKTDIKLVIDRSAIPETLFIGDEIEIETTIQKVGGIPVSDVAFEDSFSSDFTLTPVSGCDRVGNKFVWKGELNKSTKHVCLYRIRPLRESVIENVVGLSYDVLGKIQETGTSQNIETINSPVLLDIYYENKTFAPGEILEIKVSLRALEDFRINDLSVSYPEMFSMVEYSDSLRPFRNSLSIQNIEMKKDETNEFTIKMNTSFEGGHEIQLSLDYVYKDKVRMTERKFIQNYEGEMFYIYLYQRGDSSVLRIGNTKNVSFKNIEINVEDNSFKQYLLNPRRFKEFEFSLMENKTHDVNVRYITQFGQILEKNYGLKYGVSTDTPEEEELVQQEEASEQIESEETEEPWIDTKTILVIIAIAIGAFVLVGLIILIRSKFHKSGLDKEIEEIRDNNNENF